MTNQELTEYVRQISLKSFGWKFKHTAQWNSRLRTTGGRFFPKDCHLDFNPKLEKHEDFEKIVLHELVHYHLFLQKRGYKHGNQEFKNLLAAVGGLRYAPTIERNYKYFYLCKSCGAEFPRTRKVNIDNYRCGKCNGKLVQLITSKN